MACLNDPNKRSQYDWAGGKADEYEQQQQTGMQFPSINIIWPVDIFNYYYNKQDLPRWFYD